MKFLVALLSVASVANGESTSECMEGFGADVDNLDHSSSDFCAAITNFASCINSADDKDNVASYLAQAAESLLKVHQDKQAHCRGNPGGVYGRAHVPMSCAKGVCLHAKLYFSEFTICAPRPPAQCTKLAPFNVLIRVSSPIKYTGWLCRRDLKCVCCRYYPHLVLSG